jgi:hypothetical protein
MDGRRRGRVVINDFSGTADNVVQAGTIRRLTVYGLVDLRLTPISGKGAAARAVAVTGLTVAGAVLLRAGFTDDRLLSALAFLAAGSVLLACAYALGQVTLRRWRLSHGRYEEILRRRLDTATAALARTQRTQWKREERLRRLQDPFPLPVKWTRADPLLADHWPNVGGGSETGAPLDLDGTIEDIVPVFDRIPSHRLVVLGAAGAGKSVVALRFVLDSLDHHQPGDPVPVLLTLPTWDPLTRGLWEWVADRLSAEHPELGEPSGLGTRLADELACPERILLVLDGLDEMPPGWRGEALLALNRELDQNARLLLTARPGEYRDAIQAADVVTGAVAVELRPLRHEDLAEYLNRSTRLRSADGTTKWEPLLARLRDRPHDRAGRTLRTVLSTPLMAALARTAYSDTDADPADLLDTTRFPDPESVENHLIDRLIPAVYDDAPGSGSGRGRWPAATARRWLTLLARDSAARGGGELAWWTYQAKTAKRAALAVVTLAYLGLVLLVYRQGLDQPIFAQSLDLETFPFVPSLPVHLAFAVIGLPILAVALLDVGGTRPMPTRLQFRQRRRKLLLRATLTALGALLAWRLLQVPLPLAAAFAVVIILRAAPSTRSEVSLVTGPRTLLRGDRTAALVLGIPHAVLGGWQRGFFAVVLIGPLCVLLEWNQHIGKGLITGWAWTATALGVCVIAFCYGVTGTAWGRFMLARLVLAARGTLPWRIMDFLDDAHQRGVLRRHGGVYTFRHESLRARLVGNAVRPSRPRSATGKKGSGLPGLAATCSLIFGVPAIADGITHAVGTAGPFLTVPDACSLVSPGTLAAVVPATSHGPPEKHHRNSPLLTVLTEECRFETDESSLFLEADRYAPTSSGSAVQAAQASVRAPVTTPFFDWKTVPLGTSDDVCGWGEAATSSGDSPVEYAMVRCQNIVVEVAYGNLRLTRAQTADTTQRLLHEAVETAIGR